VSGGGKMNEKETKKIGEEIKEEEKEIYMKQIGIF